MSVTPDIKIFPTSQLHMLMDIENDITRVKTTTIFLQENIILHENMRVSLGMPIYLLVFLVNNHEFESISY